jgi:hypothetical protein
VTPLARGYTLATHGRSWKFDGTERATGPLEEKPPRGDDRRGRGPILGERPPSRALARAPWDDPAALAAIRRCPLRMVAKGADLP